MDEGLRLRVLILSFYFFGYKVFDSGQVMTIQLTAFMVRDLINQISKLIICN